MADSKQNNNNFDNNNNNNFDLYKYISFERIFCHQLNFRKFEVYKINY